MPNHKNTHKNTGGTRRKKQSLLPFLALIAVLIVVSLVVFFVLRKAKEPKIVVVAPDTTQSVEGDVDYITDMNTPRTEASLELAALLGSESGEISALGDGYLVKVDDLHINPNLSEDWMNVLLLGSDERNTGERARTDTIIIASINKKTGEVKLTSIMRDTAIAYEDLGEYNGVYRINAATYFGGDEYLIKLLNEKLELNISYYVHVNFYGFQQIVQQLGGIDVDVTEAEQEEINKRIVEQARWAYDRGMSEDRDNIPYQFLEEYGPNVHLDGRMALAYSRIRHVDSDFSRTERQRKVLMCLTKKLKGLGAAELLKLGTDNLKYISTNMSLDSMLALAMTVSNTGLSLDNISTLRLPANGTYVQELREGQSMLYDTNWLTNASTIFNFIYD